MNVSSRSFYREPSDKNAVREDASFCNDAMGTYVGTCIVADGNSAAYSPNVPPVRYGCCGLTGGQMASMMLAAHAASSEDSVVGPTSFHVGKFLGKVNRAIRRMHLTVGKDPCRGDDVGGASFVVAQIFGDWCHIEVGGDCFALYKDKDGYYFLSGFDDAARQIEEDDIRAYTSFLDQAGGNRGEAWNLYQPHYAAKRVRCANRNIGKGGFASLNGDPCLLNCFTKETINLVSDKVEWMLLGSDGMLHRYFDPQQAEVLWLIYEKGGIDAILKWRDEKDYQPHIGYGQWPEASAVELKFSA